MAFPNDCTSWFDCLDGKKSHNLPMEMIWKLMIKADENGCPALNVTGNLTAEIVASVEAPVNSATTDFLIEEDTNALCLITLNAWKVANPTFKVIFKISTASIDKQAWLITYTS